jgi:hypothetical protein
MNKPKEKWAWISMGVRSWTAWYRFITLARLSHAFLVVMRLQAQTTEQTRGPMNAYYER